MTCGPSHRLAFRRLAVLAGCVLATGAAGTMAGCSYWPAVRESYSQRVRVLDGPAAAPAKLVVVQARVVKLRYPHFGWKTTSSQNIDDVDTRIPAPVTDRKQRPDHYINSEPDNDDVSFFSHRVFITAMAYLKIVGGKVPHHSGARYIDLDFGNDRIMEYYLSVGRVVTLRFTPGGRLYDIPHAPP